MTIFHEHPTHPESGAIRNFIVVVALAAVIVGGVLWLKSTHNTPTVPSVPNPAEVAKTTKPTTPADDKSADQDKTDNSTDSADSASRSAADQHSAQSKSVASTGADQSAPVPSGSPTAVAATGPSDTVATVVGIIAVFAAADAVFAYRRSRRALREAILR